MLIKRRDVLLSVITAGVAAGTLAAGESPSGTVKKDARGKRRSQYQPNSPEVRTFYRVNKYPVK